MALYKYLPSASVRAFVQQGIVPLNGVDGHERESLLLFCASRDCAPDLAARFAADAVVEIHDEERFRRRFETALRRNPRFRSATFEHRDVEYYDERRPPSWLFPDQALFAKPLAFAVELEHRYLVRRTATPPTGRGGRKGPRRRVPAPMLRLGYLGDCCRVVAFGGQPC